MWRAATTASASLFALAVGCTHDFGAFESGTQSDASADTKVGDSTGDGNDGAPVDTTPCTPQESCLVDAQKCAAPCDSTETSCVAGCFNPSCRNKCHDTANACRADCATACTTCTTNAGCPAPTDCATAAK